MDTHRTDTDHSGAIDRQPALLEVAGPTGIPIGRRLLLVEDDSQRAVFLGTVALHLYDIGDADAERVCIAMLSRAGLAFDVEIAEAFGCHRNTVGRLARQLAEEGLAGVVAAKRGPKGRHKVTGEVQAVIDEHAGQLGPAALARLVAERTGVVLSREHVRRLSQAARLAEGEPVQVELDTTEPDPELEPCGEVAEDDETAADDEGDGPDGPDEGDEGGESTGPAEAGCDGEVDASEEGASFDPPATLPDEVSGSYIGLALFYPAVAALGLVEIARQVFTLPRSVRFGVRAVALTLLFLTLLGRPTVESAKHLRRASFGAVVGCGRAPSVKTLRRKLDELAGQGKAGEFATVMARRFIDRGIVDTAYLYIDGHMQAYSGKRRLEKVWSTKRRMPLAGINTYHVGDVTGRPLLFVTEALSTNLAKAMPDIIATIRETLGSDTTFTVVFDRGGYDGSLFTWLDSQGIGFITYDKGDPDLPTEMFVRRETRFEGRRMRMQIAQDTVTIAGSGPWRRVVVRTADGHQTPILTNLDQGRPGPARLACLAFARWRQENLFKYMGAHHGLDQLVSHNVEDADPDTTVTNPERKRLDRDIAALRKQAAKLKAELGDILLDEPKTASRTAHGIKVAQHGAIGRLRELEDEIDTLVAKRKPLPTHVSLAETGQRRQVMRLEHKHIVDAVKICAYNAEQWLLDRLIQHYPNRHDVRDLLRSFARLPGHITTTDQGVIVTLEPPDTPAHRRALEGLIGELNTLGATYPGTDIPVTYQLAVQHSRPAA